MSVFQATNPSLFFSKDDPLDVRLGDQTRRLDSAALTDFQGALKTAPARTAVLGGYPDDEGIRLNGGRPGAKDGPDTIRKYLYRMTPSWLSTESWTLWDAGNLNTEPDLAARHETARSYAAQALAADTTWIGLGGGHDYGYADGAAYLDWCQTKKIRPLILNFDAHMDVRSTENGLSSGTPFFRLLERQGEIDFAEIGIQSQCNSPVHVEWARSKGARILSMEELTASGEDLCTAVLNRLGDWVLRPRPAFLSLDIDAFSSSAAMGCSQSWPTGFEPEPFLRLFSILLKRLDVRALGLYEVSPRLDQDDRTSKLAAVLIHRFLYRF